MPQCWPSMTLLLPHAPRIVSAFDKPSFDDIAVMAARLDLKAKVCPSVGSVPVVHCALAPHRLTPPWCLKSPLSPSSHLAVGGIVGLLG